MSIKVSNLFYTYMPKTPMASLALNDVSLEIKEHSFTAFVGHTGSGKSTLVQMFNALLKPSSGKIEVDNFVVETTKKKKKTKNLKELRKHVGLVFQFPEYQLFEESVEKDVAFGVKNFGAKDEEALEKAHKALLSVGIPESYFQKSPFELSGGEKRRVAIAGILAIEPDILVLDEPTAGLDLKGSNEIMSLLQQMHKNGTTIILVTHDMDIVMKYCSDVFVLNHGQLIFNGTPSELFENAREEMAVEIPPLYVLAKKLIDKGFKLNIENIRNVDDLISQLKEVYH